MVPGCKRVRRLFHASENGQGPAFCAAGADAGESFDRLRRIEAGVFPVYGLSVNNGDFHKGCPLFLPASSVTDIVNKKRVCVKKRLHYANICATIIQTYVRICYALIVQI